MARIGIYVERHTFTSSQQMNGIMKFALIAQRLKHRTEFLFRTDMFKIPDFDAIYIRAFTDPLNSAYVAARIAEAHGVKVIDDSDSIRICCDKVNMYRHLMQGGIPIPKTLVLNKAEITEAVANHLFKQLGTPLVLKATNGSFSMYVERVRSADEFVKIGKRYLRRADRIIVQQYIKSEFDWRVGILGGAILYVCQYTIPKKHWKIATYSPDGGFVAGPVHAISLANAPKKLLQTAQAAAKAIGNSLYGVDLKQVGEDYVVIEVNDNPTINAGDEDQKAPDIYEKIIQHLVSKS